MKHKVTTIVKARISINKSSETVIAESAPKIAPSVEAINILALPFNFTCPFRTKVKRMLSFERRWQHGLFRWLQWMESLEIARLVR